MEAKGNETKGRKARGILLENKKGARETRGRRETHSFDQRSFSFFLSLEFLFVNIYIIYTYMRRSMRKI